MMADEKATADSEQARPMNSINNERARRIFRRRKESVKRKSMELSILCDIEICTIILGPNGQIETWPENSSDVKESIRKFQELTGKKDQGKRRVVELYDDMVSMIKEEIDTVRRGQFKKVMPNWDNSFVDELTRKSSIDLVERFDSKIRKLKNRLEFLNLINAQKESFLAMNFLWRHCNN